MLVSQVTDHITSATIGGAAAIDFGISNDPALMNVLSKALYTDQLLAVVRETLCNAWDAHIDTGQTDKPIEILLDDKEFVIRDFGTGIPRHLIGPIYCVYGGTTKKNDGRQTGGFGLGCKAPFAYRDNFEVTSWSIEDNKMTVYNLSKSNAETEGRPSAIPVVSVPRKASEQGLRVRITLTNETHYTRFEQIIRRVVANGGINATLNGIKLQTLPWEEMEHDFLITREKLATTNHLIFLRYGNVVYPVEKHEAYSENYEKVYKMLSVLPNDAHESFRIVFQAQPDTVSITPSREALSMQEGTISVLAGHLENFIKLASPIMRQGFYETLNDAVDKVWINSTPATLFDLRERRIPNLRLEDMPANITKVGQIAKRYAARPYGTSGTEHWEHDLTCRIRALSRSGGFDRKLLRSFDLCVNRQKKRITKYNSIRGHVWMKRYVAYPLVRDLDCEDNGMSSDKLFFYMKERQHYWGNSVKLFSYKSIPAWQEEQHKYLLFTRKILILAHSRLEFEQRAKHFPIIKHWFGGITESSMLYVVPRSTRRVEEAREFFKHRGYNVLDLTVSQPWEHEEAAAPLVRDRVIKPKRKGLPKLKSCLTITGSINFKQPSETHEDLLETPQFVVKYNPKNEETWFPRFTAKTSRFIISQWGDVGGFVVNENQAQRYIKAGAMTFDDFLLQKIYEKLTNNQQLRKALSHLWDRCPTIMTKERYYANRMTYEREHKFLKSVYSDKDLLDYFELEPALTDDEQKFLIMWDELKNEGLTGTNPTDPNSFFSKIQKIFEEFPVDKKVTDLFDAIRTSPLLKAFDPNAVVSIMTDQTLVNVQSQHRTLLRDMLLQAIEV